MTIESSELPLLPHLHTLAIDWVWAAGPAMVTAVLRACPSLWHLDNMCLRGFPAMPLIAQLCPHLQTLWMDHSDVIEPILCPLPTPLVAGQSARGRGRGRSGRHGRGRAGQEAGGSQASSSTPPAAAVSWLALEHLSIISRDQQHTTSNRDRLGRPRIASTLAMLSSAPRLRYLFLDLMDAGLALDIGEMRHFVEQLPSMRSIGWVNFKPAEWEWVRQCGWRGKGQKPEGAKP